jgi:hypothetical protein
MTVFTPDSSKIEHERRLLDFEELLPQWLPYGRDHGRIRVRSCGVLLRLAAQVPITPAP